MSVGSVVIYSDVGCMWSYSGVDFPYRTTQQPSSASSSCAEKFDHLESWADFIFILSVFSLLSLTALLSFLA